MQAPPKNMFRRRSQTLTLLKLLPSQGGPTPHSPELGCPVEEKLNETQVSKRHENMLWQPRLLRAASSILTSVPWHAVHKRRVSIRVLKSF